MTRSTDTRARVRELAAQITSNGGTPTPSLIRELLGKGSPNTIVSELRAWQMSRTESVGDASGGSVARGRAEGVPPQQLAALQAALIEVQGAMKGLADLRTSLEQTRESLTKAGASSGEGDFAAEVKRIEARFEGVQKYMLLQVNEAREEALRWKQRCKDVQEESGQLVTTMRQKVDALLSENAWLKGRLNEPMPKTEPTPLPRSANTQAARVVRPATYPGHPRAAFGTEME